MKMSEVIQRHRKYGERTEEVERQLRKMLTQGKIDCGTHKWVRVLLEDMTGIVRDTLDSIRSDYEARIDNAMEQFRVYTEHGLIDKENLVKAMVEEMRQIVCDALEESASQTEEEPHGEHNQAENTG